MKRAEGTRPRTIERYRSIAERHLLPALGRRRLDKLTPTDVRRLLSAKTSEGLAATTVRHVHAVLRNVLGDAERQDLVIRNVARSVRPPARRPVERRSLTLAEARVLLDTIADDPLEAMWLCALTGGLRRGEVLGVRWQDVDLDTSVVRIRQAVQRTDTGVVVTELKTDRSRRTVPIPVRTAAALKTHRAAQAEQRMSCPIPWPDTDLVFTTSIGTPLEPRNVNRSWYVVRRRAGLDWLRLHDLRHACATFLIAAGASPRTVMAQLGHSQIALTMNTYAHVLEEVQREAIDRLGDTLFG